MKRIIFAIHGIRSGKKDNWVFNFVDFLKRDSRFENDYLVPYVYGYIPAVVSVFPPFKYAMVKKVKKDLREILRERPSYELNIVAHSYGTELSYWAVKSSEDDSKSLTPIAINKMILAGSVVTRGGTPDLVKAGRIKRLDCYCSYEDEVAKLFNPFGRSGASGVSRNNYDGKCYPRPYDNLEIYNHQEKTVEHNAWFTDKYFKEWTDIIATA